MYMQIFKALPYLAQISELNVINITVFVIWVRLSETMLKITFTTETEEDVDTLLGTKAFLSPVPYL